MEHKNSRDSPVFVLHGLWLPEAGLSLWVEKLDGHRLMASLSDVEVPAQERELFSVVDGVARGRHEVQLQTPKGKHVRRVIPTWDFISDDAVALLVQLRNHTFSPAMAPDLRFLVDVAQGLERWALAGRALVAVVWEDNEWWPQWRMVDGLQEMSWRAQVIERTPPVVVANGGKAVVEDLLQRLFHWTVNVLLSDMDTPVSARQGFVRSLVSSEALRKTSASVAADLAKWRGSAATDNIQLIFVLEEPAHDDDALWSIRIYYRVGVSAPDRLNPQLCKPSVLKQLRPQLHAAQKAFPPFETAPSEGYGLDVLLTAGQVVELVRGGVEKLRAANIDVMLPKAWLEGEPSLKLVTKTEELEPTGAAPGAQEPRLGFNQLVKYQWKLSIGDTELSEAELRTLAKSGSGLVKLRDKWVHADARATRDALRFLQEQTAAGEKIGAGSATLKELRFDGGAEQAAPVPVTVEGEGWLREAFNTEDGLERDVDVPVPAGFVGQLRDYQQRGVNWLAWMSLAGFGVILADDMGLGKTVQILTLLQYEKETREVKPTLLVVPTGVLRNWAKEAATFTPTLRLGVLHGGNRPNGDQLQDFIAQHDIVLTTYGVATRDAVELGAVEWEHIIADEAQAIKNPNSQAFRALRSFPARQRIAMTGTPVENNLGELRSIMDFCNPGMLGSARTFRSRFAMPIERDGNEEKLELLRSITSPFVLRRMKTDPAIVPDLPNKDEQTVHVALTAEQAFLYEGCVKDIEEHVNAAKGVKKKGVILAGITKLKQICNHPAHYQSDGSQILDRGQHRSGKLIELDHIIDAALDAGEKVLVFTQFVEFGNMLAPYLSQRCGVEVPFIKGQLTPNKREQAVELFNSSDGPPIMVLSTLAAGVGINLTAANHVVHMDRWWNPAVENQATDRAYRIGQLKDVKVHKLVAAGTLEERIDELIFDKSVLADAVVQAGETKLTEMTMDQLHSMWRLDKTRATQLAADVEQRWENKKQQQKNWIDLAERIWGDEE
ncbi:DEAD/DEAH box helicase [Corynebacterium sp. H113]|uniref:DEAD/DEAH box helicase n=1 Tax=Corynebacterium sp. H113 TaxID=3133419 RepID=UPI0030B372E3